MAKFNVGDHVKVVSAKLPYEVIGYNTENIKHYCNNGGLFLIRNVLVCENSKETMYIIKAVFGTSLILVREDTLIPISNGNKLKAVDTILKTTIATNDGALSLCDIDHGASYAPHTTTAKENVNAEPKAACRCNTSHRESHGSHDPIANVGNYIGLMPVDLWNFDTSKHIEEFKVTAITYSMRDGQYIYEVVDENGVTKKIPERDKDNNVCVENMDYIYKTLNEFRKYHGNMAFLEGQKALVWETITGGDRGQRVVELESVDSNHGKWFANYKDKRDGRIVSRPLEDLHPLENNAPRFSEGQTVCVTDHYAHSGNKYKVISVWRDYRSGGYSVEAELIESHNGAQEFSRVFIHEADLMLAPKSVVVTKKKRVIAQ